MHVMQTLIPIKRVQLMCTHWKDTLNVQCGISQVCQKREVSVEGLLIPESIYEVQNE